jgi:hypothetical protein
MKITKSQLKQIIKEEIEITLEAAHLNERQSPEQMQAWVRQNIQRVQPAAQKIVNSIEATINKAYGTTELGGALADAFSHFLSGTAMPAQDDVFRIALFQDILGEYERDTPHVSEELDEEY